jgi:hypothetical protein
MSQEDLIYDWNTVGEPRKTEGAGYLCG